MNVVLIGYRGSGKSAVGRILAERLGWPVVSTDAEAVAIAGTSIAELVANQGWEAFRNVEARVVAEAAERDRIVIDTGGGVVLRDANVRALRARGRLFWLESSAARMAARIGNDPSRPPLLDGRSAADEVAEVLATREPLYRAAAHHRIASETESPSELADRIHQILRSEQLLD